MEQQPIMDGNNKFKFLLTIPDLVATSKYGTPSDWFGVREENNGSKVCVKHKFLKIKHSSACGRAWGGGCLWRRRWVQHHSVGYRHPLWVCPAAHHSATWRLGSGHAQFGSLASRGWSELLAGPAEEVVCAEEQENFAANFHTCRHGPGHREIAGKIAFKKSKVFKIVLDLLQCAWGSGATK